MFSRFVSRVIEDLESRASCPLTLGEAFYGRYTVEECAVVRDDGKDWDSRLQGRPEQ